MALNPDNGTVRALIEVAEELERALEGFKPPGCWTPGFAAVKEPLTHALTLVRSILERGR